MISTVFNEKLFEYALIKPLFSACAPDTLRIVSGYASYAMASRHLIATTAKLRNLSIDLICGMTGTEGINRADHIGFISLERHKEFNYNGSFSCSYVKKPKTVHSKLYVWCKGDVPVQAFIGSANYSQFGFSSENRIETLAECDPVSALDFFWKTKKITIPCAMANQERDFPSRRNLDRIPMKDNPALTIETNETSPHKGCLKVVIPLINEKGTLGEGSGLNWGVMKNGIPRLSNKNNPNSFRDPNEAYIRVPKRIAMTGFFPKYNENAKHNDDQKRFTVLTDDNQTFSCVRTSGGFGKEIETPQDNAELGRYFRKRLGLPEGAYIDVDTMKEYGRLDVTFYKINEETYFMDFSRPQ